MWPLIGAAARALTAGGIRGAATRTGVGMAVGHQSADGQPQAAPQAAPSPAEQARLISPFQFGPRY